MPRSNIGAWRAFSLTKQADIATAAPVDTLLYFEGEPMEPEVDNFYVNDQQLTGELLPTQTRLLTKKFAGKHKEKAYPHLVALFASMAMGKDTVTTIGGTTASRHRLEIDKTIVELPTRTMIENDGFLQNKYTGIGCAGFTLSGERGGFVEFEAELIGRGAEEVDATAKPARINEGYLTYAECNLTRGGTWNGEAITGGTSLSTPLINFKLSFKNGGKGVHHFGDATGLAGSLRRGQKYEMEFEAEIEIEDASHRAALLAGTEYVMSIPMVGGVANGTAKYSIIPILPRVVYREAKKKVNDGILAVGAKFQVLVDPAYGGFILDVINLQTANYLA